MSSEFLKTADRLLEKLAAGPASPLGSTGLAPAPAGTPPVTQGVGKPLFARSPTPKLKPGLGLYSPQNKLPQVPVAIPAHAGINSQADASMVWHGTQLREQAANQLKAQNPAFANIWSPAGQWGPMLGRASQVAREMAESRLPDNAAGHIPNFSAGEGSFDRTMYHIEVPGIADPAPDYGQIGMFPWSVALHELEHARQKPNKGGTGPSALLGPIPGEVGPSLGDVSNMAEISRRLGNGQRPKGEVDIGPSYSMPLEEMRREAQRGGALYGGKTYTELLNSPAGQAWLRDRYQEFSDEHFPLGQ